MKKTKTLAIVLLFGALLHLAFLGSPIDRDAGFFMTSGRIISDGGMLYRDVFDFKPPGMHYTSAFLYRIFGNSFIGFRFTIILVNILSAYVIYEISRILWKSSVGVIAAFLFLLGLPVFEGTHFLSEQFVVLFSGIGLMCYFKHIESKKSHTLFLSGLFFGISLLYKQIAFLLLVGVLLHYILLVKNIRLASILFLSSLIPIICFLLYFHSFGFFNLALNSMLSIVGRYKPNTFGAMLEYSYANFIAYPLLWIFSAVALILLVREKTLLSNQSIIYFLFVISLVPTLFRQFPHYYIPALFFGSLISAKTITEVYAETGKSRKTTVHTAVILILIFLLIPTIFRLGVEYLYIQKYVMLAKFTEAASYVEQNTYASERILVIPNEPQIYFMSGRNPPSKYLHLDYSSYYNGIEEHIIEASEDEGVRYFVVRESSHLDEYASEINAWVRDNTRLEKTVDDKYPLKIYRRVE